MWLENLKPSLTVLFNNKLKKTRKSGSIKAAEKKRERAEMKKTETLKIEQPNTQGTFVTLHRKTYTKAYPLNR